MIVIFKRLSKTETRKTVTQIEEWFANNPRRKVCNTEMGGMFFKIRKGHVKEDIVREIGQDWSKPPNNHAKKTQKRL